MGLESGSNIDDLNASWPVKEDGLSEADDHLRLIKGVLKNTFRNIASPIFSSSTEVNFLQGVTSAIQSQLNALSAAISSSSNGNIMIGGIINFNGLISNIPSNWQLCNGTNGTPDLTNKFVYGANNENEIGVTGGFSDSVSVSHSHTANHGHSGTADPDPDNSGVPVFKGGSGTFSGNTILGNNLSLSVAVDNTANEPHAVVIPTANVTTSASGISGSGRNIPPFVKLAYIQRMT